MTTSVPKWASVAFVVAVVIVTFALNAPISGAAPNSKAVVALGDATIPVQFGIR